MRIYAPGAGWKQGGEGKFRMDVRAQGFKTVLADFDCSAPTVMRARVAALTNAAVAGGSDGYPLPGDRYLVEMASGEPVRQAGPDSAFPVWKQGRWAPGRIAPLASDGTGGLGDDLWPPLRETFEERRQALDAACAAALSGPIRFHLDASHGAAMRMHHLPALQQLVRTLAFRAMLEVRDNHPEAAWTNLLASTRLVTAFSPEPVEIAHLVRIRRAAILGDRTWEWLQAKAGSDGQLARLQREWETVDYFGSLPETAAFSRASMTATIAWGWKTRRLGRPMNDGSLPAIHNSVHGGGVG